MSTPTAPSPVPLTEEVAVRRGPLLLSGVGDGPGLAAHRARWGEPPLLAADALHDLAQGAGLRGRGGAGFPFARKLATVVDSARPGRRPVVVVNASEGEPASAKDAVLVTTAPHLVLDGAAAAARAVRAREVHVVLPGDRPRTAAALARAVAARSDRRLRWRTARADGHFVAGQSTAVGQLLEGRENRPVTAWQPDAVSGVRGRPTLLSNAETWGHLGALVLRGLEGYLALGTPPEPGTTLLTVTARGRAPRVHEVEHGTPLASVLPECARGGPLLVGGFHGAWLRPEDVPRAVVSRTGLADLGVPLGAGVVHAPGPAACPVSFTTNVVAHLASQSAGRCGPCFRGLPALADATVGLVTGRAGSRHRAEQLTGLVVGRGACAHPDGTVRLVRSLLTTFADEVAVHADGGCTALAPAVALGRERAS
jgi:NADH:ubiquinone oxidoreductase subunit F (NADH-binding)